jgi:hypothetical protein
VTVPVHVAHVVAARHVAHAAPFCTPAPLPGLLTHPGAVCCALRSHRAVVRCAVGAVLGLCAWPAPAGLLFLVRVVCWRRTLCVCVCVFNGGFGSVTCSAVCLCLARNVQRCTR